MRTVAKLASNIFWIWVGLVALTALAVLSRACDDDDMTAAGRNEIRYRTADYDCTESGGDTVCQGR